MWVIVNKLVPTYYRKLDNLFTDTGRYRELSSWRKNFKNNWIRAAKTLISLPLNPKYRPDTHRWVCTCPHFHASRWLLCKHLVQAMHPVPPHFFLEVNRNRTSPFWAHPSLKPLLEAPTPSSGTNHEETVTDEAPTDDENEESDKENANDDILDLRIDAQRSGTFSE